MDEKDTQSASIPLTSSASVNRNPKPAIRSFSESYNRSFNVRPHVNFQSTTTDNTTSERPPFVRAQSIRETVSNTARFFGVPLADSNNQQQSLSCNANLNTNEGSRWKLRRLRYMNRCYGGVNETARKELDLRGEDHFGDSNKLTDDLLDISPSQLATPLATPTPITPIGFFDITPTLRQQSLSRSGSVDSHVSRMLPPLERRDSVAKMAWDRFSSIVQK
ncbi:unnamed protein product [Anisakis simplex]|uniref:Uncharacterized protein n=1 Tax=Anisakis simplex TaxID=6269 RepID=A0A0M3K0F1_ANISI|nr:unnamed protein product [Anisakis simplex]